MAAGGRLRHLVHGFGDRALLRNTTIPTRLSQTVTTSVDNQRVVTITAYQGESDRVADNRKLGTFALTDLPPAPRGAPQIEVVFDIDANGIVHVSATDLGTGAAQSMTITGGSALPAEEIDRMACENAQLDGDVAN